MIEIIRNLITITRNLIDDQDAFYLYLTKPFFLYVNMCYKQNIYIYFNTG